MLRKQSPLVRSNKSPVMPPDRRGLRAVTNTRINESTMLFKAINLSAVLLAVAWFARSPGWEAAVTALGLLSSLIALEVRGRSSPTRSDRAPRRSLKIVARTDRLRWSSGSTSGRPAMQVVGEWFVTNILPEAPTRLLQVRLRRPDVVGSLGEMDPIAPSQAIETRTIHWIEPPICEAKEDLVTDVEFVDQFGNVHRLRQVRFRHSR